MLRIDVFSSDPLNGLVTDQTEITCESEGDHEHGDESEGDHEGDVGDEESSDEPDGPDGDDALSRSSEEPGDEPGDEPGEDTGDDEHSCSIADLTPGTAVHEAELTLTDGGQLVFEQVELVK